MKKIISIIITATLVLSVACPVSAQETNVQATSVLEKVLDDFNTEDVFGTQIAADSTSEDKDSDVSAEDLFEELKTIPQACGHQLFRAYNLNEEGAYEYYTLKYGDTFNAMLLEVKKSLSVSKSDTSKRSAILTGDSSSGSVNSNISWYVSDTTLTIEGTGEMEDYGYDAVTYKYTKAPWESLKDSITKVVISSGITYIGAESFRYFEKLSSVSIPSSVTSIGKYAFYHCEALESVTLPDNIEEIYDYTFGSCKSLASIVLPDSLRRTGYGVFSSCEALSYVYIGQGLSVVCGNPFYGCTALKEFNLSPNSKMSLNNGALIDENNTLIAYPAGRKVTTYTIPSGITSIGRSAFEGSSSFPSSALFENLIIPDSVISIGDYAFEWDYITSVTIGKNVEEIGDDAFEFNDFTSLELPEKLTRIGNEAISGCFKLKSVTIPKNVISIGYGAFDANYNMTEIKVSSLSEYFKSVDGVLYSKDGKIMYQYPDGKTSTSYTMPDTVEEIKAFTFYRNEYLENISFSDNLKSIGWSNFSSFNLAEEITLPDSLVEIDGTLCFWHCDKVKKVTVGKSVAKMEGAFYDCESLQNIYFVGNLPDDYYSMLQENTATVYYPKNDSTWNNGKISTKNTNLTFKPWDSSIHYRTDISAGTVTLSSSSYTYDGTAKKPIVTVKYNFNMLKLGIDYEVYYSNNLNAGEATVKIEGIGDYYGTIEKSFTINKASQVLSAAASSSTIKKGSTATISATGYGSISYSSSKTSVATVSSTGVITAKDAGSTTITVNAAGNGNYKSASKTLSITVTDASKKVGLKDLTYSFNNSSYSFGYGSDYRIPLERYLMFYTPTEAKSMYDIFGEWGGSCSGFASSSMLFNDAESSLSINSFNSSAKAISDLKVSDKSSALGLTVQQLIESLQVGQLNDIVYDFNYYHRGKYDELVDAVKWCDNGGMPVYIAVKREGGGHALVGYKYEYVNSSYDRIHVYDCNYPNQEKYVTLYKSGGKYTGFNYTAGHTYTSSISYVTIEKYLQLWESRNTAKNLNNSIMSINSDNFEIKDFDGNTVALMSNGELDSKSDDIYEVFLEDVELAVHEIHIPTDSYRVESFDDSYSTPLEITVVNADQSASVTTQSKNVDFFVDDSQSANIVNVSGKSGENYEIVLNSETDYTTDNSEIVFSGKSNGSDVTIGTSYGEYINDGYTDSGIRVEGVALNLDNYAANNISLCDFKLNSTSYTFTGGPIEPDFTITGDYGNTLSPGVDYTVVCSSNIEPGTAAATVYGINNYKGKLEFEFNITKAHISSCEISLEQSEFVYTGEEKTPIVKVELSGTELTENEDYTIKYSNNINVGTATVTVTGIGNLYGTVSKNFTIKDKSDFMLGDVNLDNEINIADVTLVQRYCTDTESFTDVQMLNADVDFDGDITIKDVTRIQYYIAKIILDLRISN